MQSHHAIIQSFKEILQQSISVKQRLCPDCGSAMEHYTTRFYFEDGSMDVRLPFCPGCTVYSLQRDLKPN
jgi:ribosomal protein S27AE